MSYELKKPYSQKDKADFIVLHNHQNGREIAETKTALYALEPWEVLDGGTVIDNTVQYELKQAQKEQERIAQLNLTAADVERAIYRARGMDFDDVVALVENSRTSEIDVKALKIELRANNFYRGNPYIDAVGTILGFTKTQLDEFFETNDYAKLQTESEEKMNEEQHGSTNGVCSM